LRLVEQLSAGQIADILGISSSAVRSTLSAGRKQLRVMLAHLQCEIEERRRADATSDVDE
jgi:DNA-directed RNA polymerase specialized sigma24 family protein